MKKAHGKLSTFYNLKRYRRHIRRRSKTYGRSPEQKTPIGSGRVEITIPAVLDLDRHRHQLLNLLADIQDVLLNKKRFLIDHRYLKSITMDALLVLTAEIERCSTLADIKLRGLRKFAPKSSYIQRLLKKIGYWDYFNITFAGNNKPQSNANKLYLKIVGDTQVSGEKLGSLIDFFEELISFDVDTKDKFSDAMTEAAANTVEHAYRSSQKIGTIDKWWLTASIDKEAKEISFIFYDQGVGILNTLTDSDTSLKLRMLFKEWIGLGKSKGEILKKLITTNLSSYKDERRGNGLISFKAFIDQVEEGELTIHTDNVSYSAVSDSVTEYPTSIDGTLIVWKIKANHLNEKCIYLKD